MNRDRSPKSCEGVLIVGHGTRHEAGLQELRELAQAVANLEPDSLVQSCFLELSPPTIAEAIKEMAGRGVRRLIAAPIMLFSAAHVQVDIPQEVADAATEHPELEVSIAGHLGCHDKMIELSNLRFSEALGEPSPGVSDPLLQMVGRGSHDPGALAEMQQFTRLCASRREVVDSRIGYMAMSTPPLEEALEEAGRQSHQQIVVQPHLLFEGVLLERLRKQVAACRETFPSTQWHLAERLGPHALVAETIVDRVSQARQAATTGSSKQC